MNADVWPNLGVEVLKSRDVV